MEKNPDYGDKYLPKKDEYDQYDSTKKEYK